VNLKFWRRGEKRRPPDLLEIIEKLQVIRIRLSNRVKEVEARYRELFEQVVKAHMEGDHAKAAIYAGELAELRKMLRNVMHASLLLEGVIYRISAVKDLSEASSIMAPLREILSIASDEISGVAPMTSEELRKLMDSVEDLSVRIGHVSEPIDVNPELSEEARRILEEASAIAAQRRRDRSPA